MATFDTKRRGSSLAAKQPHPSVVPLKDLSASMFSRVLDTFDEFADAGKSDLIQGYGSTLWMNDLLWGSGLITDFTFEKVAIVSDIFALLADASLIPTLFGASSPFTPQQHTKVDAQKPNPNEHGNDEDEEGYTEEMIQGLIQKAALIPAVVGAIG